MEANQEGPRNFAAFLASITDGEFHQQLSEQFHALLKKINDQALDTVSTAKGSIVVSLSIASDEHGIAHIVPKIVVKEPTPKKREVVMWMTPGANLSPENPRQTKLPLKQVKGHDAAPRDVGVEKPEAKSV